jgi:membrane associated rhomboid family serine protease
VLGAYIIYFTRNRVRVWVFFMILTVPAWAMIGLWAAQQFLATIGSIATTEETKGGVAYGAHAGGFVAGILLALLLRGRGSGSADSGREGRYFR